MHGEESTQQAYGGRVSDRDPISPGQAQVRRKGRRTGGRCTGAFELAAIGAFIKLATLGIHIGVILSLLSFQPEARPEGT